MIRPGFLDIELRQNLIELARDGLAAHRLARRANALVLLDDDPFHIHGASFRILANNGRKPSAEQSGWKDVILVEDRAEVLVRFDNPAPPKMPFMYHCHILEHEDHGMMGQFAVV